MYTHTTLTHSHTTLTHSHTTLTHTPHSLTHTPHSPTRAPTHTHIFDHSFIQENVLNIRHDLQVEQDEAKEKIKNLQEQINNWQKSLEKGERTVVEILSRREDTTVPSQVSSYW